MRVTFSILETFRGFCSIVLLGLSLCVAPCSADEGPGYGLFITVPNPITSEAVNRVKETTTRAVQRQRSTEPKAARSLKIVYDFNPGNRPAGTRDFGPCHDLALFLRELHEVHTVAFVHAETTKHTVLPILACRDIVMAADARLGDIRRDDDPGRALPASVLEAYREVIAERRCPAVVFKMIDRDLPLVRARRVKGGGGDWFIDLRRKEIEAGEGIVVVDPTPVVGPGLATTLYTQELAERLGLCTLRRDTRQDVAQAYGLVATSLREDPLLGREPNAWHFLVRGAITESTAESLKRQIGRAISQGANLLFLEIDASGGETMVARDLADYLRQRRDDRGEQPVMTVAYIPKAAPDTAAFLALGCSEIVLQTRASFGDCSALVTERRNGAIVDLAPEAFRASRESLEGLLQAQGYPPLLARALMERELTVYQVRDRTTGALGFVSGEDWQSDQSQKQPRWGQEQRIKEGGPLGRPLVLNAEEAVRWGIARHRTETLHDTYALYGVNPARIQQGAADWLDDLAELLRRPLTRFFLVMIGIACLILELKIPGAVGPGVLAAVCFVLFFWAHSQTAGLDVLAILLFLLGLVLIALEVFVIPGFGVAGVSGILLVVFSLALVALEKRPHTSEEWAHLATLMAQFGVGLLVAIGLAFTVGAYLPYIPYLNRLILKPASETEDADLQEPNRPEVVALLGAIGVAATPLRPAGKVQFGEEYVDVLAEGGFVDTGTRVQVVEIEGNRIVVKELV